jgi:ATP-dependent Clp protease ATP-binding subunit ClpA
VFDFLNDRAKDALARSHAEAAQLGHDFIAPVHVFMVCAKDDADIPAKALRNLGLDPAVVCSAIAERVPRRSPTPVPHQLPFTPGAKEMLEGAVELAQRRGDDRVRTVDLFLGCLAADDGAALGKFVARAFGQVGLEPERVRAEVVRLVGER